MRRRRRLHEVRGRVERRDLERVVEEVDDAAGDCGEGGVGGESEGGAVVVELDGVGRVESYRGVGDVGEREEGDSGEGGMKRREGGWRKRRGEGGEGETRGRRRRKT